MAHAEREGDEKRRTHGDARWFAERLSAASLAQASQDHDGDPIGVENEVVGRELQTARLWSLGTFTDGVRDADHDRIRLCHVLPQKVEDGPTIRNGQRRGETKC